MGAPFLLLIAACTILAAAAVLRDTTAVYGLSVLTGGLAVPGYTATRLVASPMLADDVGNRGEPLGLISIAPKAW